MTRGLLALLFQILDLHIHMLDLFLQQPFGLGIVLKFRFRRVPRVESGRRIRPTAESAGRSWIESGYPSRATLDSPRKSHQEWVRFRTPPDGLNHSVLSYTGRSFPD